MLLNTPIQETPAPKSHGKGKGKKSKKVVQQERQMEIESRAETTANLIIRGMFLAAEDLVRTKNKKICTKIIILLYLPSPK